MVVVRLAGRSVPVLRLWLVVAAGALFILYGVLSMLVVTDPGTSLLRTISEAFITNLVYTGVGMGAATLLCIRKAPYVYTAFIDVPTTYVYIQHSLNVPTTYVYTTFIKGI